MAEHDHMVTKDSFNHSTLNVNKDGSLSANKHELNATLRILRDHTEEFPVEKGNQIPTDKIDECIKEHHDGPLQEHPGVTGTLQLLQQHCQFPNMRQVVEAYWVSLLPMALSLNAKNPGTTTKNPFFVTGARNPTSSGKSAGSY
jgi:hypothetical protein